MAGASDRRGTGAVSEQAHLKPLTSLRFFAAYWVVFYHYWPALLAAFTPGLVAKGYLGVELFFVLSGFILCHVYLAGFEAGRFRYAEFIWARLARIYPMHLATMAGIAVMGALALASGLRIDPNVLSLAALPANLALVQAWGLAPVAGWNHPSWSISAEWLAYLSFPAFAIAAARLAHRPWLAVVAAAMFLAALYAVFDRLAGFPLTHATIAWGALRIVPCFGLGCALHLAWRAHAAERRTALAGALGCGLAVIALAQIGAPDVLIVAACAGLIFWLAQVSRTGSALGSSPILVYLGEISYSIYMVCIPWQLLFVNLAARVLHLPSKELPLYAWLILLAGPIPLAAATHHLIERPARVRMKLWRSSRQGHEIATETAR